LGQSISAIALRRHTMNWSQGRCRYAIASRGAGDGHGRTRIHRMRQGQQCRVSAGDDRGRLGPRCLGTRQDRRVFTLKRLGIFSPSRIGYKYIGSCPWGLSFWQSENSAGSRCSTIMRTGFYLINRSRRMPISRTPSKARLKAFNRQSRRCYYCGFEMWLNKPDEFALRYGITLAQAARFKCTAEHLVARCDGGRNEPNNIAAACAYCNSQRHRPRVARSPEQHRAHVQRRIDAGRWHARL